MGVETLDAPFPGVAAALGVSGDGVGVAEQQQEPGCWWCPGRAMSEAVIPVRQHMTGARKQTMGL